MRPEDQVELAKRYFAAETRLAARKDDSELDELVAELVATLRPDVVMDLGPLSLSRRGIYHGPDEVLEFSRDEMHEAWSEYEIRVERELTTGPYVVLIYSEDLVARRSGVRASQRAADIYEIKDGRIASIRFFRDPARALKVAGLPAEQP
jgi:ketosteroid isomerase-like protein